jgi:hypothetical protein
MSKKINKEDLWCEYSDMPSPLAYTKRGGYVGMSKREKPKKIEVMKKVIQKVMLFLSFKFPKKKRKSIWDI